MLGSSIQMVKGGLHPCLLLDSASFATEREGEVRCVAVLGMPCSPVIGGRLGLCSACERVGEVPWEPTKLQWHAWPQNCRERVVRGRECIATWSRAPVILCEREVREREASCLQVV